MKSELFEAIIQTATDIETLKKDASYYQDFPEDDKIIDLETLVQKIEVQFGCIYLRNSPPAYKNRQS